jgi:DNA repair protein RadD
VDGQRRLGGVPFIGLSATPWTKGLGRLYDKLIIAATTKQLINDGYLAPFRVFAPSHPDLTGVRTLGGDYHEGELSEAMQKGTLTADIVTTWLAKGENRPTLCFAVDRAHAKQPSRPVPGRGRAGCGYVDGNTLRRRSASKSAKTSAGRIKVVCNVGVLTTGVDWDVRCIILARPTKSEMLFVQIIGRGLRTAPGKSTA